VGRIAHVLRNLTAQCINSSEVPAPKACHCRMADGNQLP
jgi:hypothetical protein